jgi:hypothetical protein
MDPHHPLAGTGFGDNRSPQTDLLIEEYGRAYVDTMLGVVSGPFGRAAPGAALAARAPGGLFTRGVARVLQAESGRALFGKGGLLNSNPYVRIGLGRRGGESVFRIAIGETGSVKLDLVVFGRLGKAGP